MGVKQKRSLTEKIRQYILNYGPVTCKSVQAVMGQYITAALAAQTGRKAIKSDLKRKRQTERTPLTTERAITTGKRVIINNTIHNLLFQGDIRKISKGVYGPPLKLHVPPDEERKVS